MTKQLALWSALVGLLLSAAPLTTEAKKNVFTPAPPPPAGQSLVYIYRIKVPPALRSPKILVDGTAKTKLPNNSYSWFYVKAGTHAIKTKWGFMSDVPDLEFVANVLPDQTHYLKLEGSERSWGLGRTKIYTGIKEMPESEALKDLEKVKSYAAAGDASTIADDETEAPAPAASAAENRDFPRAEPPSGDYALVYIYRPDAPPAFRRAGIVVDDREVVKLPNKAYSWFYLKEGSHTIKTSWGKIYRGVDLVEIPLTVQASGTYYLRLSGTKVPMVTYDRHTSRLDPVDAALADKEMRVLRDYEAAKTLKVGD